MPYIKRQPKPDVDQAHDELVAAIKTELRQGASQGPGPIVIEELIPDTLRSHVYVIWDRWAGVDEAHRTSAILDAYRAHFGDDVVRRISSVIGLTKKEAERLGIRS